MKKKVIIYSLLMLVMMGVLGGCKMETKQDKTATKEEQIEFLKKHEDEMTEYVKISEKKYDGSEVEKVVYDWNTVKVGNGMEFQEKSVKIYVKTYDKDEKQLNGFSINIYVNDLNNPEKITKIT